jgi:hypothetical protein
MLMGKEKGNTHLCMMIVFRFCVGPIDDIITDKDVEDKIVFGFLKKALHNQ